jgi:hypothetical protein
MRSQPHALEHLAWPCVASAAARAGCAAACHVVQRAELGQQVVELVDEAQVLVAQAPLLRRIELRHVLAHQLHLARAGRIEPAQQVQQRALAGARGADDGQRLAGMHVEVDAVQHLDVEPPSWKRLVSPRAFNTTSLIAQRLGRVHAAGAPARVQRGEEGQHQRNDRDRHDVALTADRSASADQVDVLRQEAGVEQLLQAGTITSML